MILDSIENSERYKGLSPMIDKAFDFLTSHDLKNLSPGRHELEGENLFALVLEYDTHPILDGMWEAHRKYYDIQYILEGRERIAISHIDSMTVTKEYDAAGDYSLFAGEGEFLTLKEKDFIILNPYEVHQPGILISDSHFPIKIKKIVVKAII